MYAELLGGHVSGAHLVQFNKIDLLKAESIGDLIHAETELQRDQAVKLVQGNASNYYNDLREKIIKSLAFIEAKIDFAEEDLPEKVLKFFSLPFYLPYHS